MKSCIFSLIIFKIEEKKQAGGGMTDSSCYNVCDENFSLNVEYNYKGIHKCVSSLVKKIIQNKSLLMLQLAVNICAVFGKLCCDYFPYFTQFDFYLSIHTAKTVKNQSNTAQLNNKLTTKTSQNASHE